MPNQQSSLSPSPLSSKNNLGQTLGQLPLSVIQNIINYVFPNFTALNRLTTLNTAWSRFMQQQPLHIIHKYFSYVKDTHPIDYQTNKIALLTQEYQQWASFLQDAKIANDNEKIYSHIEMPLLLSCLAGDLQETNLIEQDKIWLYGTVVAKGHSFSGEKLTNKKLILEQALELLIQKDNLPMAKQLWQALHTFILEKTNDQEKQWAGIKSAVFPLLYKAIDTNRHDFVKYFLNVLGERGKVEILQDARALPEAQLNTKLKRINAFMKAGALEPSKRSKLS